MDDSQKDEQIEGMADFFNLRSGGYDNHMRKVIGEDFNDFYDTVSLPMPNTDEALAILDLGCGTGLEIEGIYKKVSRASLVCVDLSREMLSELKEKYSSHDNLVLVEGSYLEYGYEPDKYDFVVSVMTMHHLEHDAKRKLYGSIHATLKEGACYIEGDYVVNDEREKMIFNEYTDLKKDHPEIANGSCHIDIPFSKKTQLELFRDAGFSKIDIIWEKEKSVIFVAHK
jgi:tRNA (cmo5U34)-methyltransferase